MILLKIVRWEKVILLKIDVSLKEHYAQKIKWFWNKSFLLNVHLTDIIQQKNVFAF